MRPPISPLAPSSHHERTVTTRRDRGALGAVLVALTLVGACGGSGGVDDAGMPADGGLPPGVPGTVAVLPAAMEGPSFPVDRFDLRIASIRLVGDRGAALDPHMEGIGLRTVTDVPLEIPIGDVPPALYSAVELRLASDASGPALELVFTPEHGPTVDLTTDAPLVLDARCEHGAVVNTMDAVRIGVDFALGNPIQSALVLPVPAPGPDGIVHLNESTAPLSIAAFRAELAEVIHAECGPDAT